MPSSLTTFLIFFVLVISLRLETSAQTADEPARPKVGLALSGGSAKGLAHIGVLKVLEEEGIPVDVVTGTSMGSIVGGLYAAGYSAAELEDIVTGQNWSRLFSDQALRSNQRLEEKIGGAGVLLSLPIQGTALKLPSGLLAGQEVLALLTRLTWPYHGLDSLTALPLPFTAIGTNLRTGAAVPLTDVSLPLAIRTSMSLPSFFAPVEIDGELYIDGGLARNLPAEDAFRLGADVVIGVDVGDPVDSVATLNPSLVDVLLDASWFQALKADSTQRALADILIRPNIDSHTVMDLDAAAEWIVRGESAARAMLPELRALVDSLGLRRDTLRALQPPSLAPVLISNIDVVGVAGDGARLVRRRLDLPIPARLGPDDVDAAISRVYGTGVFKLVTYRLMKGEQGGVLRVEVKPEEVPDRIGFGFRYDSSYKAELLFNLTLKNRLSFGSTTEFRVRLGEQSLLQVGYLTRLGVDARLTAGAELGYASAPVNLFVPVPYARAVGTDPDVPVLGLRLDVLTASLFGGFTISEAAFAGVRLKGQNIRTRQEVAGVLPVPGENEPVAANNDDQRVLTAGVLFGADTFDRIAFPTRGLRFLIETDAGVSNAVSLVSLSDEAPSRYFQHARLDAEAYLPIAAPISLFARGAFAYGAGDALPLSYYNFLGGVRTTTVLSGGFLPLYGLDTQARFGRKAYLGIAGVQWEVSPDLFVRVLGNIGNTYDILQDDERDTLDPRLYDLLKQEAAYGYGLEFGLRTPLGPVQIILSENDLDDLPRVSLNVGYSF